MCTSVSCSSESSLLRPNQPTKAKQNQPTRRREGRKSALSCPPLLLQSLNEKEKPLLIHPYSLSIYMALLTFPESFLGCLSALTAFSSCM